MSKARARERAKARKGKKRVPKVALPGQQFDQGGFSPDAGTTKAPTSANVKNFGGAKRGAGRSG